MAARQPVDFDLESFAQAKGFTGNDLRVFGVRVGFDRLEIPYYTNGAAEYGRLRVRYDERGFRWSAGSLPAIPYGLQRPVPYTKGRLVITEGESDCWALWLAGVPALGLPGATATACLELDHLEGVREVGVVEEPDDAGKRFPLRVANRLRAVGFTGSVRALSFAPSKDPRDARNIDPSAFVAKVAQVWKAGRALAVSVPSNGVLTSAEVLADEEPISYRVDGFLPVGGSLLLGAQKKVGKSVLLLNVALAVARGVMFLDRATAQTRVLYLSLDEPRAITKARMRALGWAGDAVDFVFDARSVPQEWAPWLRGLCARGKYGLLVVDTLAKLTGIREINDYGEWNRVLAPLKGLQEEFGLSWIGSAHNRKDSAGGANAVAGSMAVTAGVDTILVEQRLPGGQRTLESEQRFGIDLEPTVLRMNEETFALGLGDEQWIARRKVIEQKILFLMGDGAERSGPDIIKALHVRKADLYAALEVLLAGGLLVREGNRYRFAPGAFAAVPVLSGPTGSTSEPSGTPDPPEPAERCGFFVGPAGSESCARCGVSWQAHP